MDEVDDDVQCLGGSSLRKRDRVVIDLDVVEVSSSDDEVATSPQRADGSRKRSKPAVINLVGGSEQKSSLADNAGNSSDVVEIFSVLDDDVVYSEDDVEICDWDHDHEVQLICT